MVLCHSRRTVRIGVLPEDHCSFSHSISAGLLWWIGRQTIVHTPADGFREGDAAVVGPSFEPLVLFFSQLDLCPYHDVINMTSWWYNCNGSVLRCPFSSIGALIAGTDCYTMVYVEWMADGSASFLPKWHPIVITNGSFEVRNDPFVV